MRVPTLAFLVVAGAPSVAFATPLSELAESLEPGEWGQLATDGLLPVIAESNGGATGSIFGYSEDGVWDPSTGQFFFLGSDHIYDGQSSGARFVAFTDASNAWRVVQDPVPWLGAGTNHGYDHGAILDGGFYQMTLTVGDPTWRWDTATETWEERAPLENTAYNRFGGLEPFPEVGGLIYVEGGSVHVYDDAADSWETIASEIAMGPYHNFAEYNPVHGMVLFGGGNDSGALHGLDANLDIVDYEDVPFPLRVTSSIVTVDPNSGDYLLFGGDGDFLVFEVEAQQLLEQPGKVPWFGGSAGPVDLAIAGPISSYGVVMFVKQFGVALDGSAEVWLYRHAPGSGDPPGDPPDDDSGGSSTSDDSGDASSDDAGTSGDPDGDGSGSGPGATSAASASDAGEAGGAETSAGADTPMDGADGSGCGCRTDSRPLPLLLLLVPLCRRKRRSFSQDTTAHSPH